MKRYLVFRNLHTRETTGRKVDVTGRSEREIAQITGGMLINIGENWFVDEVEEPDDGE